MKKVDLKNAHPFYGFEKDGALVFYPGTFGALEPIISSDKESAKEMKAPGEKLVKVYLVVEEIDDDTE